METGRYRGRVGGPALLESYEIERHPVGARNQHASGWAAQGVAIWRALVRPGEPPSPELIESALVNHARMHGMVGVEFGYSYAGSPIVVSETDGPVEWDINVYTPSARPGDRLPHMWLDDGRPIQDLLGDDYTVIVLQPDAHVDGLLKALRAAGAPVKVLQLEEDGLRKVYESSILLVRPDLHVAWRGDQPPPDPDRVAAIALGRMTSAGL